MRFEARTLIALVLLSSPFVLSPDAAGQGRAPASQREAAVPFKVGETLTYEVSWSSFVVAGTAVTTVVGKTPAQGAAAYTIVAEGRPLPLVAKLYPIYYKMDSLVDALTLLSRRSSIYSEEGGHRKTETTRFDRGARKAVYEVTGEGTGRSELSVPTQTQDGLAALYALRALSLRPGARLELPVANQGELFTVSVAAGGAEHVRVPFGALDAVGLKLTVVDVNRQPVGNNMAVWISTDSRRLPVKLQAELPVGDFVLALKDVR